MQHRGGKIVLLTEKEIQKIIECSEIKQDGVKNKCVNNAVTKVYVECDYRLFQFQIFNKGNMERGQNYYLHLGGWMNT